MHPAIVKAQNIARAAKEHDWTGSLESEIVNRCRVTILKGTRNDEEFTAIWRDGQLDKPIYALFGRVTVIPCAKTLLKQIESWPDIVDLLKKHGEYSKHIMATYRKLPFDVENDDDVTILNILAGRHIWWYAELVGDRYSYAKVRNEWVMEPRRKSQVYNLKHFDNGRILFNFTTADTGMRSVFLDSIIKVG